MSEIRVVELFAGVGGFRLGLERASISFITVLANQWEPNAKKQWAYENYCSHWGKNANCICEDIAKIKEQIPPHDLLVGGFCCQPFSVARSSDKALGLEDTEKGQMWWHIFDIAKLRMPKYILLENVDRLLISPSKQRGRDFAIMLYGLNSLGYSVEWRVINAADYGNAQRRRRIFIFAFREDGDFILNKAFPIDHLVEQIQETHEYKLPSTLENVFNQFKAKFENYGTCVKGKIKTKKVLPKSKELPIPLSEIISVERERAYRPIFITESS